MSVPPVSSGSSSGASDADELIQELISEIQQAQNLLQDQQTSDNATAALTTQNRLSQSLEKIEGAVNQLSSTSAISPSVSDQLQQSLNQIGEIVQAQIPGISQVLENMNALLNNPNSGSSGYQGSGPQSW